MSSDEREQEGGGCQPIVYSDPRGELLLVLLPSGLREEAGSAMEAWSVVQVAHSLRENGW